MQIVRAYCVQAGKVVDVYQARALFFAQEQPRCRFQLLCSDDACRAANATKVTGVNYDKLVEAGDCIAVRPHFRMNPDSPHIDACEWVVREKALRRPDDVSGHARPRARYQRFRRFKATNLVAVFWPKPAAAPALVDRKANGIVAPSANRERKEATLEANVHGTLAKAVFSRDQVQDSYACVDRLDVVAIIDAMVEQLSP
jgi:hypothetical protein